MGTVRAHGLPLPAAARRRSRPLLLTGDRPSACLAAVDDVWTKMESATEAEAAATGNAAISALPFTCWQNVCPAFAGETPVRYDQTHLTPAFAERLAPILQQELQTRGLY